MSDPARMSKGLSLAASVVVVCASLGAAWAVPPARSVGRYGGGSLQGARALPPVGPDHYLLFPPRCYRNGSRPHPYPDLSRADNFYGHPRVVDAIVAASQQVRAQYPAAPLVPVGELSNRLGGRIPGHLSHQNGLDVDVYFLARPTSGASRTVPECRDGPRFERISTETGDWEVDPGFETAWNWALAAAFAARRDVKVIFIGGLLRKELDRWARANGVPRRERRRTLRKLHAVFCRAPRGVRPPFYRNNWCPHDDHFHVRFRCPPRSPGCRER